MAKRTARRSSVHRFKYTICVSGASDARFCSRDAVRLAREVGKEIVRQGGAVMTGATTGIPYYAAKGAKELGGLSIGFSPAASRKAHVKTYRLPTDVFDLVIYTGFDFSGRNLILSRSADAVITICGRMGTLNEFTIAFEDRVPQGVLLGSGGVADHIRELVARSGRKWKWSHVLFDDDPKRLVRRVIALIENRKVGPKNQKHIIRHYDGRKRTTTRTG